PLDERSLEQSEVQRVVAGHNLAHSYQCLGIARMRQTQQKDLAEAGEIGREDVGRSEESILFDREGGSSNKRRGTLDGRWCKLHRGTQWKNGDSKQSSCALQDALGRGHSSSTNPPQEK